jgi:integrin-linked kinase-associated serine/threonine phosphatase 2C
MAHQKREANPTDEDLASKRPKGADPATETAHVEPGASQEANDEMRGSTSHNKNEAQADKSVSQETVLIRVEADAAEDKGCRHTMEDAWVVLPDAGAESPTNLR